MKLVLKKEWPGLNGMMKPGEYRIPEDISHVHARRARADGAGEIVAKKKAPERARKGPAPENKAIEESPDTKG